MTETTAPPTELAAKASPKERKLLPVIEIAVLAILIAFPLLAALMSSDGQALDFDNYFVIRATTFLLLAMLAISFDLCWGYSGIMSFGQALFFGVGGYTVAKLSEQTGVTSIFIIVPVGMIVGTIAAALVGWFILIGKKAPTIIFVALGSLTASFAAQRLVAGLDFLGGANGYSIWSFITVFGTDLEPGAIAYYVALAFLLIAYLISRVLVRSQFGLALAGIRQNEDRLMFLGYRLQRYKLLMFCTAGMIAGWAGAAYAFYEGFVGPSTIGISTSTFAVLYGLFGGVGTLIGPVIGTFVIEGLTAVLSDNAYLKAYWPIALGVIMLVVVAYRPTGLVGLIVSERERFGSFGIANLSSKGKSNND